MGYSEQGRQRLHPEEALYLLECVSGLLGLWERVQSKEWEGPGRIQNYVFVELKGELGEQKRMPHRQQG